MQGASIGMMLPAIKVYCTACTVTAICTVTLHEKGTETQLNQPTA